MLKATHSTRPVRGRFAPSPTGRMHLGNAWAVLCCWLGVRSMDGQVILRIEDIDPDRSRDEFRSGILEDLAWLGLDWDEGPDVGGPFGPYTQSQRLDLYETALKKLEQRQSVYPCFCTRKELREAASAPHRRNAGPGYPGFCRLLDDKEKAERALERTPAIRCIFPETISRFEDLVLGTIELETKELGGDFPVRRSDGVFAYQLAVTLDDCLQEITQVVRGEDILDSTPRQLLLFELLGYAPPQFAHVPILVDKEGKKLSKRHQSLELAALRAAGIKPESVIGYLAYKGGLKEAPAPVSAAELMKIFSFDKITTGPIMVEPHVETLLKNG